MYAALYERDLDRTQPGGGERVRHIHALVSQQPGYRGLILLHPEERACTLTCLLFDSASTLTAGEATLANGDTHRRHRQLAAGAVRYADVAKIAAGKVAAYADVNGSSFDPAKLPDLALRRQWAAFWQPYDGHCGWLNIDSGAGKQFNLAFFASAAEAALLDTYRTTQEEVRRFAEEQIAPRSSGPLVQLGRGPVRWCDLRAVTAII